MIAVASSKHEALLRNLSAEQFLHYTTTSVETAARDVDLVTDAVGDPHIERFLSVIKPGGALFLVNSLGFSGRGEASERGITVSSIQERESGAQLAKAGHLLKTAPSASLSTASIHWRKRPPHTNAPPEGGIQGKVVLSVV